MELRYGLIGEKLGHSYSKEIHEQLAGYCYDLIPLSREEFPVFMEERNFRAINVTIPYKQAVLPYLAAIDENAKKIGAVNTILNQDGVLYGYNTDFWGFLYALRKTNIDPKGKKVLVLGNGGSAKAVFAALSFCEAGEVITVKYREEAGTVTYETAAKLHADASIIVNTSPVGMFPNTDASPIDLTPYTSLEAAVDLIYNPATTRFLAQAKERGIPAVNGLTMLVAQAYYAMEHFLGRTERSDITVPDPAIEAVLQTMSARHEH